MESTQPAEGASVFRYFSPLSADFEPHYLVPTQVVSEPAQRNLRGLTPEQAAPWLQRYPVLHYYSATEGFIDAFGRWITPTPSGFSFQHPIPEWVAEVWADRAADFDKRLNVVRTGLGGYPLYSDESSDGFAVVFADETGLVATNWEETYVFFPAHPTESALDRAFVTAVKYLPENRRKAFVDAHLNDYPDARAFVCYVGKIAGNEALFVGAGLHDARVFLLKWYTQQQGVLKELEALASSASPFPKSNRTELRPLALSLQYRLISGDNPFRDGTNIVTKKAVIEFGKDNGVSGQNFYQRAWMGVENETERLKVPADIESAISLLTGYPAAQELARVEWERSTGKSSPAK